MGRGEPAISLWRSWSQSLQWQDCLAPSQLEPWRHEGDALCDEVVRELDLRPGQDGLQKLQDRLESGKGSEVLQQFWDEVSLHLAPLWLDVRQLRWGDCPRTTSGRHCIPTPRRPTGAL